MSRYLCVHCDNRFDSAEPKPRCPKCMRVHGIEKLGSPKKEAVKEQPKWVLPVAIVAALALAAGGWAWWARRTPDAVQGDAPLRPLEPSELAGYVRKARAEARDFSSLLVADEPLENFAAAAVRGKSGNVEKARGVVAAIRARASKRGFAPWSLTEPRDTPPRTAAKALELMMRDGARSKMYPLEVAAIAVAALRAEGVDAMLAEAFSFPGDQAPPDPSGHLGYFVVAVYPGEVGQGTPTLLDPYLGRSVAPAEGQYQVLTDVEAVGAAVNLRAVHLLVREGEAQRAFADSTNALRLAPRSAAVHGARGAILIASGGVDEGVREFEAAAEVRADAARRNNLAGIFLVKGDLERAEREVSAALQASPDFAGAHGTLAAIHLQRGESEEALRELETAKRLDPDLHTLSMLFANYYLVEGDIQEAIRYAEQGVARRPDDVQGHLMLGRLYKQANQYTGMRREAQRALEVAPEGQRDGVRTLIERVLGPTALEADPLAGDEDTGDAVDDVGAGEDAADGEPGTGELQLGGGSRLLGGGAGPSGPSLLGGGEGGGGSEPLRQGGDPSTLRLGESAGGGGLHLNLNE
jgi:tetratricopeptide (TPR) repeat protein